MAQGSVLAQKKLKILYVFYIIGIPLSNIEITKLILENDYMNYFELQEILIELCNDNFLEIVLTNMEETYSITSLGTETIIMFTDKIPDSYKKNIDNIMCKHKKNIEKNRELFGHYFQRKDEDYAVILQVSENHITVFNLSLNVPDENTAKKIIGDWKTDPEKIYSDILTYLMR